MKPLVIGAAVGGVVLVAGAVALLPKEEAIEPLPVAPAPQPAPLLPEPMPEPVIEPVRQQQWDGRGGPFAEEIRRYTSEFDRDGDGVLNEEERAAAFAAFEQRMLEQWDANKDGVLSDEERRAGMESMIRERTEQEMNRRFDRDGDGQLSAEERAAMEAEQAQRQARRQQFELEQYDLNKDGQISDEERSEVDAKREATRQRFEAAMTGRFDSDGDGQLSRLERRSAGETMRREFQDARTAQRVDADGNGVADANDLAAWAQKIAAGDMGADFNRDGVLDQRDLQWANEAVATAATRQVDPAWDALMREMWANGGMGMMMGGRGGPGGGPGGGGRGDMVIPGQVLRIDGIPGEMIVRPAQPAAPANPPQR